MTGVCAGDHQADWCKVPRVCLYDKMDRLGAISFRFVWGG
jgi:hypothetical protein